MQVPGSVATQNLDTFVVGKFRDNMPPTKDTAFGPGRLDQRNSKIVANLWNSLHQLIAEGSLFVAQTATPGTGIAVTPATGTSFSDTSGLIGVNNADTITDGTGKDIFPLWLKLIITAAGTAGTDSHVASRLDKSARVSAGTALVSKCLNPGAPTGSDGTNLISVLPTIAAAGPNVINCGRAEVRKAAAPGYTVGDTILFLFGCVEQVMAQPMTATTAIDRIVHLPGLCVPPGWSWVLNEWMANRTAAQSAEVEFGYAWR